MQLKFQVAIFDLYAFFLKLLNAKHEDMRYAINFSLFIFLFFPFVCFSQIRLPRLISDGVILQRDRQLTLWGWASVGEKVTLEFQGKKIDAVTGSDGKWKMKFPPQRAGGPFLLKFKGKNEVIVNDVMFGDVWLCSGQSNMELTMERVKEKYPEAIANSENANIRHFLVPDQYDFKVRHDDVSDGKWVKASPATILSFSAVAYFFGRGLFEQYHVPVGLINAALGGSPIEAWMSEDALKPFPEAYSELQKFKDNAIIDEIESQDRKRSQQWYRQLNATDSGLLQRPKWYEISAATKSWEAMKVPGNFPTPQNGAIWFRKEINLPGTFSDKPVKLWLGRLIDQDSVFVNGKFAGTTGYQYPPRRYDVPAGVFTAGKNLITIRLISSSGIGGFAEGKRYYVASGNDTIDLSGDWQFRRGTVMPPLQGATFVRWKPAGLFNKMVSPLISYSIKGVIWYQGESNTRDPEAYDKLLPAMIADWRGQWGYQFPFLIVQLPNYKTAGTGLEWAELREAQRHALSVPSTGMVVAIDAGEWNDLHPLRKKIIGDRLALLARKIAYGEKNLVAESPVPLSAVAEGNTIEITFDQNLDLSRVRTHSLVNHVQVSDDGVLLRPVVARITKQKITITIENGQPQFVYYAWADHPGEIDLYNKVGLPVPPFKIKVQR
jgi:sialate O-acetylesterase